ncbi:MAG: hypothetical protein EA399_16460, partial [Desulfovibrionales bacterium]
MAENSFILSEQGGVMQRWFLMVVLLSLFVIQAGKFAQAQELPADALEEFRAEMQDFFKFTSSILITFTSQTGVTQGRFVFSSDFDEDYSLNPSLLEARPKSCFLAEFWA